MSSFNILPEMEEGGVDEWVEHTHDFHPEDWGLCPMRNQKWPIIS